MLGLVIKTLFNLQHVWRTPWMPQKPVRPKVKAASSWLFLHLFPELPSFSHLGHYGHGLIQPHSLPFHCAFLQGCAHISDSSGPWSSVSVAGKTPGGRRKAGWEALCKHQGSQAPAGMRHRLGQQCSHRVLRWCFHRIDYACIYFIFHFHGCKHFWDFLGSPCSPMSLSSHHTGFLSVCIYLNIFF